MSRRRIDAIIGERDPQVLAENVRRAREYRHWTRSQLCEEAGISPQTLARVEAGRGCTPGVEAKIARAVGTVVGRLWESHELPRALLHTPETDRWYFASQADGESYRRAQDLVHEDEPIRFDPEAIQEEAERMRMGAGGLVGGFVRVTTSHLRAGFVISSLIELYRRVDSDLPVGRLAYFHCLRGEARLHIGTDVHPLRAGDVLVAEMAPPAYLEPAAPVAAGALPPLVSYVDVQARLNPQAGK